MKFWAFSIWIKTGPIRLHCIYFGGLIYRSPLKNANDMTVVMIRYVFKQKVEKMSTHSVLIFLNEKYMVKLLFLLHGYHRRPHVILKVCKVYPRRGSRKFFQRGDQP